MGEKTCSRCRDTKPLDHFNACAAKADGRSSWCRTCFAAYNKAKYVPKARKKLPTEVALDRRRESSRRWARKESERQKKARLEAKSQLKRACKECGEPVEASKRVTAVYCSEVCMMRNARRRWVEANPAKYAASVAKHQTTPGYKAKRAASGASWRRRNLDVLRVKENRRRALKARVPNVPVHPLVVLEMSDGICGICGHDVDPLDFHVDHVIPLSRGGHHTYDNTQSAHPVCNIRKRATLPWDLEEVA